MATNTQGSRPVNRSSDPTVTDPTPTPVVTPSGVGGVEVYDRDVDGTTNPSLRPSASMREDQMPVETRSSGSILGWIIGAIVLIILAYFLYTMLF
jgi:hypothetical protein